jgi:hypothetical protein
MELFMSKQTTAKFNAGTAILSLSQCVDLIANVGDTVTILVQGDMGSGKTSLLKEIAKRTGMRGVYFDCTTKDLGDLYLPRIKDAEDGDCVSFVPNEEFGIHFNEPIVLMLDELGKNRSILNGLLRVMQEGSVGSRQLPKGSIVFATTNLGAENVGDMLPPHARNRIMIVRMRKPDAEQWMAWGAQNNIDPALLAAVHEFPQMLASFTDVDNPTDNPYIYDPRDASRTSFVTPRSLEKVSHLLKKRNSLGDDVVLNGMIGLIGAKAATDIMTMVNLGDTLPKYDEIVKNPKTVKVPSTVAAQIMSALTCMQRVDEQEFRDVFSYVQRLPMEIQALFANQIIKSPAKGGWASRQASFTEYAAKNYQMFTN